MIAEEYDDELPPITVNSRNKDASEFTMPSADVLASQRAREEECERELRLLRELHVIEKQQQDVGTLAEIKIVHSDSSGSEGESALATAVDALCVQPVNNTTSLMSVDMVNLLYQLLQLLPEHDSQFLQDYLEVLKQGNPATTEYVTHEMLAGIEAVLQSEHSQWEGASVLCCSAWLCAQCMGGVGLRGRRALHALLHHATDQQVEELGRIMSETLCTPQLLLELSDAVQGAPGAPRDLATHLVQYALDKEGCAGERYTRVQLAGRAAAAGLRGPPSCAPRWRSRLVLIARTAQIISRLQWVLRSCNFYSVQTTDIAGFKRERDENGSNGNFLSNLYALMFI